MTKKEKALALAKARQSKKVAKALSPEEKTIVDNIMSLAQELSAGESAEEDVMMAEDEGMDYMEEEEVKKEK